MSETVQNATGVLVGVSVTTSTSVATGMLDTVSQYAPVIGLGLSVTSIILAVVFFTLNHRRDARRQLHYIETLRHQIKQEIIGEMMIKQDEIE